MAPVSRAVFRDKNKCKHTYVSPKPWRDLAGFEAETEVECPAPQEGPGKDKALGDKSGGTSAPA